MNRTSELEMQTLRSWKNQLNWYYSVHPSVVFDCLDNVVSVYVLLKYKQMNALIHSLRTKGWSRHASPRGGVMWLHLLLAVLSSWAAQYCFPLNFVWGSRGAGGNPCFSCLCRCRIQKSVQFFYFYYQWVSMWVNKCYDRWQMYLHGILYQGY
jgi:hypothetical protein